MFEFLFCPMHGIFRMENLQALMVFGDSALAYLKVYAYKFSELYQRFGR